MREKKSYKNKKPSKSNGLNHPGNNAKAVRWQADFDYAKALGAAETEWLRAFINEYHFAAAQRQIQNQFQQRESWRAQRAARRDLFSVGERSEYDGSFDRSSVVLDNPEDEILAGIDRKRACVNGRNHDPRSLAKTPAGTLRLRPKPVARRIK